MDPDGRALGPRAVETRLRLLDATEELLGTRPLRDLRVIDVARKVGTSPATFYQYFEDLEDAVVHLAERASAEMPPIVAAIHQGFLDERALERARGVVAAFVAHWAAHRAVLRVRNLSSEEGEPRFVAIRRKVHGPLIQALAEAVAKGQQAGRIAAELHPVAAAAALGAILERLAAFHVEIQAFGVTPDDLVETTARIVVQTLGGR